MHVAEAVGAHLHILFTMPWHATSVRAFPHTCSKSCYCKLTPELIVQCAAVGPRCACCHYMCVLTHVMFHALVFLGALRGAHCPRQEFGHPQARFLHEKRWRLSPGVQRALQPLLGAINRATFFAVDSAMFTGTVRADRPGVPRGLYVNEDYFHADASLWRGTYCHPLYEERQMGVQAARVKTWVALSM